MPRLPNASDLISLQEAAEYAGYRSASTLRKAAREGALRTVTLGPRAIMTGWMPTTWPCTARAGDHAAKCVPSRQGQGLSPPLASPCAPCISLPT